MKILKKAQRKIFGLLTALVLVCALVFMGISAYVPQVSADTNPDAMPETVEYIDTNVDAIIYAQHPSCVFFGFGLTESDYDDYGLYEGDFGGKPAYAAYERYIRLWLNYWENFPSMNSEGVRLDQLYAYWNGSSVGEAKFTNTVAHRSTLKLLEYGFVISIPAGTTFPSLKYVKGNCEGDPILYRTTENRAFYFNGTAFVSLPYQVAEARATAIQTLKNTDVYSYYGEKDAVGNNERAQVKALIESAKKEVGLSFTTFAVEDVLARFTESLAGIMTKADYAKLANSKVAAKNTLADFFDSLDEVNYDGEEWATILAMKAEYVSIIDGVSTLGEVDGVVRGVKFAVKNVMTKAEKAGFAEYIAAAVSRLENAFISSIYRAEEQAQGALLVSEGKEAIAAANSYGDVDGICADYIARIAALKTDAEWTAEEANKSENNNQDNNQDNNTPPSNEFSDGEATPDLGKAGCGSFTDAAGVVFATIAVGMAMVIKKKKDGMES